MRRNKLEKQIAYEKMFNVLNVENIVIFEDDFIENTGKNEICYGLARMSITNRNRMLSEIGEINSTGKDQLEAFVNEFDNVFDAIENWEDEIPYNDIETSFEIIQGKREYFEVLEEVKKKYSVIDMDSWSHKEDSLSILASYGVGVDIPNLYEELFDEFLHNKAHWKKYRIFRDFTAATQADFKKYIEDSFGSQGMMVCIIDDQMKNKKSATEIVNYIEKLQSEQKRRLNIIGLIYSSFDNSDCITDKVYFEYIKKGEPKNVFQAALTKSSYSYMLADLKVIYQRVLGDAFDEAVRNKNIAYYLSSMADYEGITNYQVITNWIKLLFEYKLSDIQELTTVAGMTRLIGLLEDEKLEFSKEMLDLNTFEAFDFSVNKYREPIASGDIFLIKKEIYILLGQDCDMMNSSTRKRKNGISELVNATTVNQSSLDGSVELNRQFLFISNFRKNKDDTIKTLKVRYGSRKFIENQILQLCQFNDDGKCILDINKKQYNASGVEPAYYETLYEELVSYYEALFAINKKESAALELILNSSQSSRVLRLNDYVRDQEQNGIVEYKIRRICRLKHPYMLYLYKMYLEHQGRHPFDCMNMSRVQEVQVKLKQNDLIYVSIDMVLTPNRDMNRQHIEKMDWYIDISNLENAVSNLLGIAVEIQENVQCIEIKEEGTKFECMLDGGEKKNMCVLKIGDMVSIEQCK